MLRPATTVASFETQFLSNKSGTLDHVAQFLLCGPASGLAQTAIGREREAVRRRIFEAGLYAVSDICRSFDIITLHIDNADSDVFSDGNLFDQFQFGKLPAGHFDVDFINGKVEEGREHRSIMTETDGPGFVIAETEMRGEATFADDRLDGSIKDFDEAFRIFLVRVTAHRGFINSDLLAAGANERFQFGANNR